VSAERHERKFKKREWGRIALVTEKKREIKTAVKPKTEKENTHQKKKKNTKEKRVSDIWW
jgi:sRNA-binding protein